MGNSRVFGVSHPLWLFVASLVAFLVLDNGIFRSGFYAQFANIDSLPVQVYNTVHFENLRPASGKREIFLVGNSRIHQGFWCKQYNQAHEDSGFTFIQGGVAGADEEQWYYILQAVDPHRDRYAAIVVQNEGYLVGSWGPDQENNYDNAVMLAPILRLSDWPGVIARFQNPRVRWKAALLAAFPSHGYAADLQDLILHPAIRASKLQLRWSAGAFWMYDWSGSGGDMRGLRLAPGTDRVVTFPADLNSFERADTVSLFIPQPPQSAAANTARNARFESYWLNKIIARYAGSPTVLIFAQVPRYPMPLPGPAPVPGAPDLRQLLAHPDNVVFLPGNAFVSLEQPRYFHDAIHLNGVGRQAFTNLLGDQVLGVMRSRDVVAQRGRAPRKTA